MKQISIPYFPVGLKIITPLIFATGIYLVATGYIIWGIILLIFGVIILTTRYVTEIDLSRKKFRDYLSFLTIPLNEESKAFNSVDRIIVTKGNYSQTINTRAQSRQLDWSDYTGTLLLDNGSLDLLTRNDKRELIKSLRDYADFLKVGVEDRTTSQYFWVDLTKY